MIFRNILFAACMGASWLAAMVSQAEAVVTGSAAGPLCRFAAWCAASSFRVEAAWGGDDALTQFMYESAHLQDCVREAVSCSQTTGHADIALLAHVLFEC